MSSRSEISLLDIRKAIKKLGLSDQLLCIHFSLRSFGFIKGGASTILDGLLAEGCTLLVPTFSSTTFAVPPPRDKRPAQNGWNYDTFPGRREGLNRMFTPDSTIIDDYMGALAKILVKNPRRIRGNHPLCSFSALGPEAKRLIEGQRPLEVFAPLKILAEENGYIVLMGVGLESMSIIHLAEKTAGRNLFIRWANGPDLTPLAVEVGGCSDGFEKFTPFLHPIMRQIQVGESIWRIFPAKESLEICVQAIQENPILTHCKKPDCERCNDAVKGGPLRNVYI